MLLQTDLEAIVSCMMGVKGGYTAAKVELRFVSIQTLRSSRFLPESPSFSFVRRLLGTRIAEIVRNRGIIS